MLQIRNLFGLIWLAAHGAYGTTTNSLNGAVCSLPFDLPPGFQDTKILTGGTMTISKRNISYMVGSRKVGDKHENFITAFAASETGDVQNLGTLALSDGEFVGVPTELEKLQGGKNTLAIVHRNENRVIFSVVGLGLTRSATPKLKLRTLFERDFKIHTSYQNRDQYELRVMNFGQRDALTLRDLQTDDLHIYDEAAAGSFSTMYLRPQPEEQQ